MYYVFVIHKISLSPLLKRGATESIFFKKEFEEN